MSEPLVLIAAGGTGGHLFPAEALAVALGRLHVRVVLATDGRVEDIARTFPAERVVEIPSATPSGRSLLKQAKAAFRLAHGVVSAWRLVRAIKPDCVVGFGGYPTVPPILAASLAGVPTTIHEQNGVMGRANRFLVRRVSAVATGFRDVAALPANIRAQVYYTGNPIRPAVLEAAQVSYAPPTPGGTLDLLVFGGSQGARVMSEVVPAALASLPADTRARLRVVQQARPEDAAVVGDTYRAAGIAATIEPFFKDLPRRMAAAQLVIGRSGASTVAELAAIGRPSILVPLPGALDQDQAANARALSTIGAATVIPQPEFTADRLAATIAAYLSAPESLTDAAAAAKSAGVTDAAERLAAIVLSLGKITVPSASSPRLRGEVESHESATG